MNTSRIKPAVATAVALAAVLSLGGCGKTTDDAGRSGTGSSTTSPSGGTGGSGSMGGSSTSPSRPSSGSGG